MCQGQGGRLTSKTWKLLTRQGIVKNNRFKPDKGKWY